MFIEKLRLTGIVVAVTTLGVASAATALMAFQEPAEKSGQPATKGASREFNPDVREKASRKAAGQPIAPPIADEAEEERAAEEVGKMRADVEMLELRSESLRGRIQDGLVLVDQLEDSLQQEYPNASDPEIDKQKKKLDDHRLRVQENIKVWTAAYLKSASRLRG